MGRITLDLLRKRAEHNDGMLSTLTEITLHNQNIEEIELVGHACRSLQILYLQNNIIGRIKNLHHLKDLQYLNLAMNNIVAVENLQGCEALQKLDLTMNFIPAAALPSLATLRGLYNLRNLYLLGNPCMEWKKARQFIIGYLPQLQAMDSCVISAEERLAAEDCKGRLALDLHHHLETCNGQQPCTTERDWTQDGSGEVKRPWCPAARLAEHREQERLNEAAEKQKQSARNGLLFGSSKTPELRKDFPDLPAKGEVKQKNEASWDYTLTEEADNICLEVSIGKGIPTEDINLEVHAHVIRLLIKGKLLQLELLEDIMPSLASSQRSSVNGSLRVVMPKAPSPRVSLLQRKVQEEHLCAALQKGSEEGRVARGLQAVELCWDEGHALPPLSEVLE